MRHEPLDSVALPRTQLAAGALSYCSPVITVRVGSNVSTTNYLHSGGALSAQR